MGDDELVIKGSLRPADGVGEAGNGCKAVHSDHASETRMCVCVYSAGRHGVSETWEIVKLTFRICGAVMYFSLAAGMTGCLMNG